MYCQAGSEIHFTITAPAEPNPPSSGVYLREVTGPNVTCSTSSNQMTCNSLVPSLNSSGANYLIYFIKVVTS
jgi:hypothetical protein